MASGIVATWKYVGSFAALVGSGYGRLVMAKIALVAVIAAAGWWNWRIVTPALEGSDESAPQWLRMGVTVELVLGSVVLAVTAVLVASWLPVDGWR
jgi:copper transport protein